MKTARKLSMILPLIALVLSCNSTEEVVHPWELVEIHLQSEQSYDNPYTDLECGVELSGPGFRRKVYGFWDGERNFVVRVVGTKAGKWTWESFSEPADPGLQGKSGSFRVEAWTEQELAENPNRHGFLRHTEDGRALEYADGHPFFMLGDTWWSAPTWRFPLKGEMPDGDYIPAEGIGLEEALHFRKKQGYNTIAMIAAFPNWTADEFPPAYMNEDSVGIRQAWEKNGTSTGQDMHDDEGNMPFAAMEGLAPMADFNRLNPVYFQNLDKKVRYMSEQGFVLFLETVRRDHGPAWKEYFEWPGSFSRYVQYIISRYGAYNIIFSGIHLDWINENYSLSADEFNEALKHHLDRYGPLPFGQPHSILIDGSTYRQFGHGEEAPWLNMHAVGNVPRNHGFYPMIEELYNLDPAYPCANLEPYYPGWDNTYHNTVAGERPEPGSARDNYFGRAQMYGSVFSGGLTGHIYGTGAYDGNTTGEPRDPGDRPYIWEGLNYEAGAQLPLLYQFLASEGGRFQQCIPSRRLLDPHKAAGAPEDGLDGWSYMLLAPEKDLAFLYFENASEAPVVKGLLPENDYRLEWFDPVSGSWTDQGSGMSDPKGNLEIKSFPEGDKISMRDWALKLSAGKKVEKIIFDTDMGSDCDDVGALALLHYYSLQDRAEIVGCIYSSGAVPYGAGIIDAINHYYGRGNIPVGACHEHCIGDTVDKMRAGLLATDTARFGHQLVTNQDAEEQTRLNRRLLASAEDGSITYMTVGHTQGLFALLQSDPDDISPLSGEELIHRKMKRWVALGALGANNPSGHFRKDWNFFFNGTAPFTEYLLEHIPVPVELVNGGSHVYTGASLADTPEGNIVRTAYESWLKNVENKVLADQRPSWDLATVCYAVEGLGPYFSLETPGHLDFDAGKGCRWIPGPGKFQTRHIYVNEVEGNEQAFGDYLNAAIAH